MKFDYEGIKTSTFLYFTESLVALLLFPQLALGASSHEYAAEKSIKKVTFVSDRVKFEQENFQA